MSFTLFSSVDWFLCNLFFTFQVHCLVQLTVSCELILYLCNFKLVCDDIIHFLFILCSLFSKIFTSSALFKDMKGVRLVEYCLMKLNDKPVLDFKEINHFPFLTQGINNSHYMWLVESTNSRVKRIVLKETGSYYRNSFMKVIIQLIRECLRLLGESKGVSKAHDCGDHVVAVLIIQNRLCVSKKTEYFWAPFYLYQW